MDLAFCIEDGKPWDARLLSEEAEKQSEEWLVTRRKTLICAGCEQKARFICGTKRVPHFGIVNGYKHDEDCDFLGNPSGRNNGPGTPLPDRAPAEGNKEVRYEEPGLLYPSAPSAADRRNRGPRNRNGHPVGNVPLHETTGLRAALRNLRNRDQYPPADLWLDVPARGPAVRATDYFYKIADITEQTIADDVLRAFWGKISSAHDDGDGNNLWINCDSKGSLFTFRIDPELKGKLYQSLGITGASKLYDAHVIVEGVMRRSNKISVQVSDLKRIAFLPKR